MEEEQLHMRDQEGATLSATIEFSALALIYSAHVAENLVLNLVKWEILHTICVRVVGGMPAPALQISFG